MSILDEIGKLTQPVFDLPDLEDEDVDGTASKTLQSTLVESDSGPPRRIRKAIDLSIDDSSKYGGTKVCRNDVFDEFSDMAGLGDHSKQNGGEVSSGDEEEDNTFELNGDGLAAHSEESGDDDNEEPTDRKENGEIGSGSELEDAHDGEEDENSDEGQSDDSENEQADSGNGSDTQDEDNNENDGHDEASKKSTAVTMKDLMKTVDQDRHRRKAESVFAQTQTWEQLLYVKIKLQAALRAFNQLPRGQLAKDLLREADEQTKENMKRAHENAAKLVISLLEAEGLLLATSSFTNSVNNENGAADSDDEEIESDEDEVNGAADDSDIVDEDDEESEEHEEIQPATSMNIKSLSKRICESEEKFVKFRDSTLIKWEGRTRLIASRRPKNASTDFSAFEKENIVSQIEKVCSDKQRLVKRSRIKKSDIERIGGNPEADEDEEIYDDDDFHQVLLKELIDKKSNNTQDPVAMTRHYIEMQKLKSKRAKRKEIDNRASKERKIKYVPIPKLVNFHPAMPEMVEWNHETRNELFKSLFS
ncbi:TRAUB domain protein [Trichostrongylus colubriformis]|uniref:TRAUB domain protein n=1 Tax=Trichostrongylus colubriformis TaxID=6319 RepID=A0AAN8G8V3_TRICO